VIFYIETTKEGKYAHMKIIRKEGALGVVIKPHETNYSQVYHTSANPNRVCFFFTTL
jgi:hypothetical protein